MSTATESAAAAKPNPLLNQRTTYLFIPYDEIDSKISMHFIEAKFGDSIRAQVVRAIPVQRLTEQHTIIVVARKLIKPVTRRVPGPDKMPEEYHVPIEELAFGAEGQHGAGVIAHPPIRVAEHWREDEHADMGGTLNEETLFPAINRVSAPFYVRHRSDEGLIRLSLV
jgi:hypothetical protein